MILALTIITALFVATNTLVLALCLAARRGDQLAARASEAFDERIVA